MTPPVRSGESEAQFPSVAWLIEYRPNSGAPTWYTGVHLAQDIHLEKTFSANSCKAIRYPTRHAALVAIAMVRNWSKLVAGLAELYATEHEWTPPHRQQQGDGVTAEIDLIRAVLQSYPDDIAKDDALRAIEIVAGLPDELAKLRAQVAHLQSCLDAVRTHVGGSLSPQVSEAMRNVTKHARPLFWEDFEILYYALLGIKPQEMGNG